MRMQSQLFDDGVIDNWPVLTPSIAQGIGRLKYIRRVKVSRIPLFFCFLFVRIALQNSIIPSIQKNHRSPKCISQSRSRQLDILNLPISIYQQQPCAANQSTATPVPTAPAAPPTHPSVPGPALSSRAVYRAPISPTSRTMTTTTAGNIAPA